MGHVVAFLENSAFRFYDDDVVGSVTGQTPLAATNTDVTVTKGTRCIVAMKLSETAGGTFKSPSVRLEVRSNGGAWTNPTSLNSTGVFATSPINCTSTQGDSYGTTALSDGSTVAATHFYSTTTSWIGPDLTNSSLDVAVCFLIGSGTTAGDVIDFRLIVDNLPVDADTVIGSLTVGAEPAAEPSLDGYRWYGDGTESGSTAQAPEDRPDGVFLPDPIKHLRVLLQNTVALDGSASDTYQLQYSLNGGAYTDVTATSAFVSAATTSGLTDNGATTNRATGLTDGTGSFVAGVQEEGNGAFTHQLTASNFTEHVFALEFDAATVDDNDDFEFRILLNGTAIPATVTPKMYSGAPTEFDITTVGADEVFTIPCVATGTYDGFIDWGDGSTSLITTFDDADLAHTYAGAAASYTVKIYGELGEIEFNNVGTSKDRLTAIRIGGTGWNTMSGAFYGCGNVTSLDLSKADFRNHSSYNSAFRGLGITTFTWNVHPTMAPPAGADFGDMLRSCTSLTTVDFGTNDMAFVDDWDRFLQDCTSFTTWTNINNLDMTNVVTMTGLFTGCTALTTIDLSGWTTSSALTDISGLFINADNLVSVNFGSGWDTSGVTDMDRMFSSISAGNLVSLEGVQNFSIASLSNVTGLENFITLGKMSTEQYSAWLINMAATAGTPVDSVIADFGDSQYSPGAAADARALLISRDLWTISDGGAGDPTIDLIAGAFALTGIDATLTRVRTMAADTQSFALTGIAADFDLSFALDVDAGALSLSGIAADLTISRTLPTEVGAFSLTGITTEFANNRVIPVTVGAFALTGITADFDRARAVSTTAASFTVTGVTSDLNVTYVTPAVSAAFTTTGIAADLQRGRDLPVDVGDFAATGFDAALTIAVSLSVEAGTFNAVGLDADFDRAELIPVTVATFVLTGIDADFQLGRDFQVDAGNFAVNGVDAALTAANSLPVEAGTFSAVGVNAELDRGKLIPITVATFVLTGITADLTRNLTLDAQAGSFSTTGTDIDTSRTYQIGLDTGAFALAGQQASLNTDGSFAPLTAPFVLTGIDAGLQRSAIMAVDTASFTLSGITAEFSEGKVLPANTASFALSGIAAEVSKINVLPAETGTFTLTGIAAEVSTIKVLPAEIGTFNLTGVAAGLQRSVIMPAEIGTFTLTGIATDTTRSFLIDADPGSVALAGIEATFVVTGTDVELDAETGTLALSGLSAGLQYAATFQTLPGVYTITGQPAGLLRATIINADAAPFTATGFDAALETAAPPLNVDPQSYSLTAPDVAFLRQFKIDLFGTVIFTAGSSTEFGIRVSGALRDDDFDRLFDSSGGALGDESDPGHSSIFPVTQPFALGGGQASIYVSGFAAETAAFALDGGAPNIIYPVNGIVKADVGPLTLTANNAALTRNLYIEAAQETFTLTTLDADVWAIFPIPAEVATYALDPQVVGFDVVWYNAGRGPRKSINRGVTIENPGPKLVRRGPNRGKIASGQGASRIRR